MADPRFFKNAGPLTLGRIAEISAVTIPKGCDPSQAMVDVAPLSEAGPRHISFLDNRRYTDAFRASEAGAAFVAPELASEAPSSMVALATETPYRAFALAASAFYPPELIHGEISPGASIHPTASIGPGVTIAHGAVVEAHAEIGERCEIGPNAVVGQGVIIGPGSTIGPAASLAFCHVGARANIHPGVRIGQRGFGFAMDRQGHINVPQLGRVIIHDDVEIGANSTIDRGTGPDTVIGAGCKIDNLVQIGHNVVLGRGCVVVAQAGIAGSTQLGDFVIVAAQGGLTGHLKIGDGARIAAQSGVMRDVEPGQTVGGSPAVEQRKWMRQVATLAKLSLKKGG